MSNPGIIEIERLIPADIFARFECKNETFFDSQKRFTKAIFDFLFIRFVLIMEMKKINYIN